MKLDNRYKYFVSSLSILVIIFLIHVFSQIVSVEALFGIKGQQISDIFAFNTNKPFKSGGFNLVTSYFVHYNWSHLVQDLFLLGFFSMLLEKTLGSLRVILFPLLTHILSLIPLTFLLKGDHLFLGSSLGGIFLFVYFCMTKKRPILLSIGLFLIIGSSYWVEEDFYGSLAHFFAILFSFIIFFVTKHRLTRPKES